MALALTRRSLLTATLGATAGCVFGNASPRDPSSFGNTEGLWTFPYYRASPAETWTARWPSCVLKRWERVMPVDVFSDEEFGNAGALPCGQLEYMAFPNPADQYLNGAVVVVRAPAPAYDPARFGWKVVGRATSGVTQLQLSTDGYGSIYGPQTLVLLVFPDRTMLFASGPAPSRQIAEAFASRSTPPPPLAMPPNAVIAQKSFGIGDSGAQGVLSDLLGSRGAAGGLRTSVLFQAPPGADPAVVLSLWAGSERARDCAAEGARQLPTVRAQFAGIEGQDRCRKPWNHFFATLSDVHAEGSDVVLSARFPAEYYAYYFGAPYPRGC